MMRAEWTFVLVLVLNLIAVSIYFVLNWTRSKKQRGSYIVQCLVMLLCPIGGILFFALGWCFYRLFFHRSVDLADVVFSKDRVETILKADVENESNLIPLKDAVAIIDKYNTRQLMLEIIKRKINNSLSTIAAGLDSDDTEVAHYSASVLSNALNNYRQEIQKMRVDVLSLIEQEKIEPSQETGETIVSEARQMVESLNEILEQHVFSDLEQKQITGTLDEMAGIIDERSDLTATELECICNRLREVGEYERCTHWCEKQMEQYPHILSSYTCLMKLYFETEQTELFFSTMEKLKRTDIPIDKETLELIRVFT